MKTTDINLFEEFSTIIHSLKDLDNKIDKNKEYTILIGPTKAGKSTLANVLAGYGIERLTYDDKIMFRPSKESSPIKIGNKIDSETGKPNIYGKYIDCPGFGDTKITAPVAKACYIEKIFSFGLSCKILIATPYGSLIRDEDSGKTPFVELFKEINQYLNNNFARVAKSLALCITKVQHKNDFFDSLDITVDKISTALQEVFNNSDYAEGVEMMKLLEDRMFLFMEEDGNNLIEGKLNAVMPKAKLSQIYLKPDLTGYHEYDYNTNILTMLDHLFAKLVHSYNESIVGYLNTSRALLQENPISAHAIKDRLQKHQPSEKYKAVKKWFNLINNSKDIVGLASKIIESKELFKFELKLDLPAYGMDIIRPAVGIYKDPDDAQKKKLFSVYKPQITEKVNKIVNYEQKSVNLLQDINNMDDAWQNLYTLTHDSSADTKGTIKNAGLGTMVLIGGATIFTGGGAAIAAGLFAGGLTLFGTKTGLDSCKAYESGNPEVKRASTQLKASYKKMPTQFANTWLEEHSVGNSDYLTHLKTELGGSDAGFDSEYNEILV